MRQCGTGYFSIWCQLECSEVAHILSVSHMLRVQNMARLKYILPLSQLTVAMALEWWSDEWYRSVGRLHDMPGPSPASQLLLSINAPAALVRASWSWSGHISSRWDHILLITMIGTLWYWIALNIETWQRTREIRMFSWLPLRIAGDLVLIVAGILLALMPVADAYLLFQYPSSLSIWLWFVLLRGLFFSWSIAFVFCFGRDLVHSVRAKTSTPARTTGR